jgi:hypothetical protein
MKHKTPSEQEIQAHLRGLNRVWHAAEVTSYTATAKEIGITNYKRWFKAHSLSIFQDRSGEWKLEES